MHHAAITAASLLLIGGVIAAIHSYHQQLPSSRSPITTTTPIRAINSHHQSPSSSDSSNPFSFDMGTTGSNNQSGSSVVDPATLPYEQRPPVMPSLNDEWLVQFAPVNPPQRRRLYLGQQPMVGEIAAVDEKTLSADELNLLHALPTLNTSSPINQVQMVLTKCGFTYLRTVGSGDSTFHVILPTKSAKFAVLRLRAKSLAPNVRLGDAPKPGSGAAGSAAPNDTHGSLPIPDPIVPAPNNSATGQ